GLLHQDKAEIEDLFESLPLIAAALFTVGGFILYAGWREGKAAIPAIRPRSAIWIGLVQGLCLPFRGFSRSGATISTALLCGIDRMRAEDFSFALAVALTPPVIIRELYRLLRAAAWTADTRLVDLLLPGRLGMACSLVADLA